MIKCFLGWARNRGRTLWNEAVALVLVQAQVRHSLRRRSEAETGKMHSVLSWHCPFRNLDGHQWKVTHRSVRMAERWSPVPPSPPLAVAGGKKKAKEQKGELHHWQLHFREEVATFWLGSAGVLGKSWKEQNQWFRDLLKCEDCEIGKGPEAWGGCFWRGLWAPTGELRCRRAPDSDWWRIQLPSANGQCSSKPAGSRWMWKQIFIFSWLWFKKERKASILT